MYPIPANSKVDSRKGDEVIDRNKSERNMLCCCSGALLAFMMPFFAVI
jgi:hypothetical protein